MNEFICQVCNAHIALGVNSQVALKLINLREALLIKDFNESYFILYSIANPNHKSYNAWAELEKLAKDL